MKIGRCAVLALALGALVSMTGVPAAAQRPFPQPGQMPRPGERREPGPGPSRPGHPPPPPGSGGAGIEWIDVHVHLVGGPRGEDFGGAVAAAEGVMAQQGIRKMIVMSPPAVSGQGLLDADRFASFLTGKSSRFAHLAGGAALNSLIHETPAESVTEGQRRRFEDTAVALLRQGAVGFGEMAVHHVSHANGHPYESVPADHPLFLLLADIAARAEMPIDVHLDVVTAEMPTPPVLAPFGNPPTLAPNLPGFERLLAHNRRARIVWAHAGSDVLGHWTVDLSRRLLAAHPNLFMSLRMAPGRAPQNHPIGPDGALRPEWLRLLQDFPDRFVLGGDQFILAPGTRASGPAVAFAQRAGMMLERVRVLLGALPPDLARAVASGNAVRIYRLRD